MATLISRASGDFTAAGTWALCSVAAELDTVALAVTVTTSNQDSTAFVLAAQEVDAVAIHVSVIPVNVSGTVTIILRNSTTATNIFTTIIDTQDLQFKDGTARGWIFVSDGTTHTPNGTDSYVIRVIRTGGSGTMSFFAASGTNWARQVRRTATAAPGTNDKLIIAGIFTGVGLNTRHTVTLDNTATTTFGPAVGANSRSITVNDKGTLQLASGSGVNYYFRWIGDFIIYAGGQVLLDNPTVASGTITGITSRGWSGRIINTTNATPIVVTSPGHGLSTGDVVRIWGNPGNTAAEGTFQITVLTASTFSLQDVTGANVAGNGDQKYPGIPTGTWHAPLVVTDVAHGLTTGDIILINNDIVCTQQVYHGAFGPHQITTWGADKFFLNSASHATNSNYTSGGTWTKRGPLVSTSTLTLDPFCNVANNDAGISVWGGGVFLSIGTPKKSITRMLEQTVIGSDTVSLNSVVDTTNVANSVVTWKEGRKFDPAWTGTIDINGTSRTITGAVTATSLTINSNAGALTGVTAAKTGTGAQLTLQIEDTTGWQVGDMMAIQSSGKGSWSSGTTIASVDSATQVTLSTAANTYASGLNDVNGDMRAYVANGTRNIQVRSTVAFAYYLTLWNQPSARYRFLAQDTVFRNIGSGTGNARGIQLTTNVDGASCYLLNCVLRDCGSSGYFLFQTSANNLAAMFPYVENTSFLNPSPNAGSISGGGCTNSQANAYFVGNFFTTSVVTGMSVTQIALTAHTNMIYTDNVHAGGAAGSSNSGYLSFTASGGGAFPVFCRNQFMGGGGGYISGVGFLNGGGPWAGLFGSGDWANRNRIVRTSGGSGQIAMNFSSGASFTTSTHNRVQFDGFELIACGWNWGGSSLQVGMDGECYLSNFTIDAGSNIFPTVGANAITFISRGSSPVLDGCEFGQNTSFGNDVGLGQASASFPGAVRPIFRNCKFGSANWCNPLIGNGVTAPTPDLFLGAISYRHNQTANLFSAYRAHRANYTANNTYTAGSLGRMDPDTVVFRTASPSLKIAPNATNGALSKLLSPTIRVPVTNGSTITPSVWVRKSSSGSGDSANYNGAQPQLILLADSSLGISTETVLATGSAAIGNWEELSATTQTFTSSGVAQLAVCLDGTTGFINIDDFSCPSVTTTTGFEFWGMESFGPMVNGEPPAGGGGSSIAFSPIGRHIG